MGKRVAIRLFIIALIIFSAGGHQGKAAASQLELYVDTTFDSDEPGYRMCEPGPARVDCSLRGAITRANKDPGNPYLIHLPAGVYTLTNVGQDDANNQGDLDLAGRITIIGVSQADTIISAGGIDRVMHVLPWARVSLSRLALQDGQAAVSQPGGGILNQAELALDEVAIQNNHAGDGIYGAFGESISPPGGAGGGIYNSGNLSMTACLVKDNQAGDGPPAPPKWQEDGANYAGAGGAGGGIFNSGTLNLLKTVIEGNASGAGGSSFTCDSYYDCYFYSGDYAGDGGDGGGIANRGWLTIQGGAVQDNHTGAGGRGGDGRLLPGDGGDGGDGGGIANDSWLWAVATLLSGNQTGSGGGAGNSYHKYGPGEIGRSGFGGGLSNSDYARLLDSQVLSNTIANKSPLVSKTADGGGIFNSQDGILQIMGSLLQDNWASGYGGGIATDGELEFSGGQVETNQARRGGGGIWNRGQLEISSTSIIANLAGPGYDGKDSRYESRFGVLPPTPGETPHGGGFANEGNALLSAVTLQDNISGDGGKGGNDVYYWIQSGDGGDGGSGGGIYNTGELEINLSALSGNRTGAGGSTGYSKFGIIGADGAGGDGGGLFSSGELTAAWISILDNRTGPGFIGTGMGGHGGGLANIGSLALSDSQVIDNRCSTEGLGGGVYSDTSAAASQVSLSIARTSIIGNLSGADGGGLFLSGSDALLENLIVAENQVPAGFLGSGLTLLDHAYQMRHLTIAGNTGGDGSGLHTVAAQVELLNAIIAGQSVGVYVAQAASVQLDGTLWGAGPWVNTLDWDGPGTIVPGVTSLTADPSFVDPSNHDYHLLPASPAVDAGIDTGLATDVDNQPRPQPSTSLADIGADEVWPFVPLASASISAPLEVYNSTPAVFTAAFSPGNATPNVSYLWIPAPQSGQGTPQATYVFPWAGAQPVTVFVFNGGSQVSDTVSVDVKQTYFQNYLPVLWRNSPST